MNPMRHNPERALGMDALEGAIHRLGNAMQMLSPDDRLRLGEARAIMRDVLTRDADA